MLNMVVKKYLKQYNSIKGIYQNDLITDDIFNNHFNKIIKINTIINKKFIEYCNFNNTDYIINYSDYINYIKDSECIPFWNNNLTEISKTIFMPTKSNITKINKPNTFSNSWFLTKHYTSLTNNNVIEENKITNNIQPEFIKCNRIKMYLSTEQQEVFKIIYGAYRYYYNRAIQYINNYNKETYKTFFQVDFKDDYIYVIDLKDIKNKFSMITMRNYLKDNKPEWLTINIPSHLIDKAFKEAEDSYNNCIKKYNKYKITFKLKPKTKKDKFQTINIEKTMISSNKKGIFPRLLYNNKTILKTIKFSKPLNNNILDSSITVDIKLNEYYLAK